MLGLVFLLLAASGVEAFVNLTSLSYVRLQDDAGAFSINASTYTRVAFDEEWGIVYVVSKEPRRLTALSMNLQGELTEQSVLEFPSTKGFPLDVEFCRDSTTNREWLAISFRDALSESADGRVRLYNPLTASNYNLGDPVFEISVGAQPVDMEFGFGCMQMGVANRGRPTLEDGTVRDPYGSITIISVPADANDNVGTSNIDFRDVLSDSNTLGALKAQYFRVFPEGAGIEPAMNVEPNNIIVSPNGGAYYVALPKNNAVARVTVDTRQIDIFPLGRRNWQRFYVDLSKDDGGAVFRQYPIFSTLMPRQVAWVDVATDSDGGAGTSQWMITLDSGFIDNLDVYDYSATVTGSELALSQNLDVSADLQAALANVSQLGQGEFCVDDGVDPNTGRYTRIYFCGGRGISIRNGNDITDVKTSLIDNIEREMAQRFPSLYNSGFANPANTPSGDREATTPTFGPDIEVIETGAFENQKVLFMGSRSSGVIYVYVLVPSVDCPQPVFHSAKRFGNTFLSWSAAYNDGSMGDIGITDMLYVPRRGQRVVDTLLVASSISNSIHSYLVTDD